jgi:hypothetical protein
MGRIKAYAIEFSTSCRRYPQSIGPGVVGRRKSSWPNGRQAESPLHCGGNSRQGKTLESAKKHRCTGVMIQKAAYVSCNGGKREAVDIPPSQIFQIGMILQGPLLAHTDFPLMTVERKTNP